jgi:hypothetical protein
MSHAEEVSRLQDQLRHLYEIIAAAEAQRRDIRARLAEAR